MVVNMDEGQEKEEEIDLYYYWTDWADEGHAPRMHETWVMLDNVERVCQLWQKRYIKQASPTTDSITSAETSANLKSMEEILKELVEGKADNDCEPEDLLENQNVSFDVNVSSVWMDNQLNQLVNDQSHALIVQEKDEIDISKTLIEGKMEAKVEKNILAFCQEWPNDKMKIVQAGDDKKSAFQAENNGESALLDGIKDGVAEPSTDDQV
uniref:Uncharacterized protein n=1 Tax=Panagrolaimus sp. JU765 TaxID=591449 RepID=A0AC34Q9P9_9BILA